MVTGRERRVDGVIHGSSGSGATVFVEPLETIELNNELVRLHEEELREVHRLLREFTARLREHAAEIAASVAALSRLELLFGKAEFAARVSLFRASAEPGGLAEDRPARRAPPSARRYPAEAEETGGSGLTGAERGSETLLISGPNTGGKTVALKTIGLLALMTHAGLPAPGGRSRIPAVRRGSGRYRRSPVAGPEPEFFLVAHRGGPFDAGAGHRRFVGTAGRAWPRDRSRRRRRAGRDVLETFRARGAFTLASTHLMAMKVYGASTQAC